MLFIELSVAVRLDALAAPIRLIILDFVLCAILLNKTLSRRVESQGRRQDRPCLSIKFK